DGKIETGGASGAVRAPWSVIQTSENACRAVGSDFADRVMGVICGVDVSRAVNRYTSHLSSSIRRVSYYTTHDGIGCDLANHEIKGIPYVNVIQRSYGQPSRKSKPSGGACGIDVA